MTRAGRYLLFSCALLLGGGSGLLAAQSEPGLPIPPLPEGPLHYATAEGNDIQVDILARGLDHPWSIAFLPDGSALVTEKNAGQIRRIVDGQLQEAPVTGAPEVLAGQYSGLLDIALHPDFDNQPYIYLSYNKPLPDDSSVLAYARGRWDGENLQDTRDIFVAEEGTSSGSRILFGPDGMLYIGIYVNPGQRDEMFPGSQKGKILRLTPEGEVPDDNPFIGDTEFLPEIYTYGHRTVTGLTTHPETGEIWETEMGPNGGDEVNLITAGSNYGWPLVSLGMAYEGGWRAQNFQMEGAVDPVIYWTPSISTSGMTFYDGDTFPEWQGDLFVGGMRAGQIRGTGQLQRIKFNEQMEEIRRESLLGDLRQRIRDVKQGPDGYLYVLTDENDGAVMRISPAE